MPFEINTPQIAAENLDGEVMAINFQDGLYFSLRDSAAAIWLLLEAHHEIEAIVGALEPHLKDAARLVPAFVSELEQHALIRYSNSVAKVVDIGQFDTLKPPVLEKFDDMQALLLLDPIHEVEPTQGWPFFGKKT
jgi:hypothetical protein